MGQFSWIYSDTNRQLIDNRKADTYLLVPEPFQDKYGKSIYEWAYDGYGHFGKYDIYDLIIEWNREMIPEIIDRMQRGKWGCTTDKESTIKNLQNYYEGKPITCELRWLGIALACYDEDNESLKYPIKITTKPMKYNDVAPSKSDPNQGWYYDEEEELAYERECKREEAVDKWCETHDVDDYDNDIEYYNELFAHLKSIGLEYGV